MSNVRLLQTLLGIIIKFTDVSEIKSTKDRQMRSILNGSKFTQLKGDEMNFVSSFGPVEFRNILIAAVGILGLTWYYLCVIDLGVRPTQAGTQPTGFRQFEALSITTISVSLATYVGYVVGIPLQATVTPDVVPIVGAAADVAAAAASSASAVSGIAKAILSNAKPGRVSLLQWLAAALYIISLVLAVWFYSKTKDETEPAITGLAKSLLGFVAGVFSLSLNVPQAT